jgi:8-oxo-dGTP pyrophosphatase MutT (NUDIX family)
MATGASKDPGALMVEPTHAGGIVMRGGGPGLRVLLVTATRQPNLWVFPKGHIEPGETPEAAAAREVEEEAGVVATVGEPVGTLEFRNARGMVRAQFYLMRFVSEGPSRENRRRAWFTVDEARQALVYEDSRMLVVRAAKIARQIEP